MPAKNRGTTQPLGHFFGTLCLQGKFTFFSTKLELAHQAYIGGAPCWGMAGHGWGLSGARPGTLNHSPTSCSPQICPIFINLSRFHQFFLIYSNLFDEFGGHLVENLAGLDLGRHNVTTRFSLDLILIVLCVINYGYM